MSVFGRGKKHGFFDVAFAILLALFFLVGIFTVGSFQGTGKSVTCRTGDEHLAVFEVKSASSAKVKTVYLNVGTIYAETGADVTLSVKRASTKSVSSAPSIAFGDVKLGNVYSAKGTGKNGALFNWVEIPSDDAKTVALLSVSADANFELNEIVAVTESGASVPLQVNAKFSKGYASPLKKLAPAVDAQNSYTGETAVKYNFTQEEAYTMIAVKNVMLGSSFTDGSVYHVDGRWNALSTLLYLPSVALFGNCTMAIRLPSLIATTVALLFTYLTAKLLFKDDKSAFVLTFLIAIGGLALTAGVVGVPYSFVFSAMIASAYFMLRFFSEGISSKNPLAGARKILYSGLFAAVAVAIDLLCLIPTLGVLALFVFGLKRQKAAHAYALEKIAPENEEAKSRENAIYTYKTKISYGFALLSFVVATFVFLLIGAILTYSAFVRAYDSPADPKLGFATLLFKGIGGAFRTNVTEYTLANASSPFAWFLPLHAAALYDGITPAALGRYLGFNAIVNPALCVFSLFAFAYSTFALVKDASRGVDTKESKRNKRIYFTALIGTLAFVLAGLCVKNANTAYALGFTTCYFAFIPLALKLVSERSKKPCARKVSDILLCVIAVLAFTCFVLSLPSTFGFELSGRLAEKLFGWMSAFNNGFFLG